MSMLWTLAWKNIWRNRLRSIVVIAAVALGVSAGVFINALTQGMVDERISVIVQTEFAHIQLHQPGFAENNDFALRIANADSVVQIAARMEHVAAICKRIVISSMVASAEANTAVRIIGVEPDRERRVSNLSSKLVEGKYLDSDTKNQVVIGRKLAEKLKVKLKNKVIVTLQDANRMITGGAFRVCGIFETDNNIFDEGNIFVRYTDICQLSALRGTEAHEIAIMVDDNSSIAAVKPRLVEAFPKLLVQDWMELSPEAGYLVSAMSQYMFVIMLVILLALGFGIVNTMLMVVLERVHELGMLMAIGMSRPRVFAMVMLETIYLTMTGGLAGIAVAYAVCHYLHRVGLDLYFWKEAYESIGYSSLVYPSVDLLMMLSTALMVMIVGMLSAVYPAYRALRLNPADAIRVG
jgi:ABC-type lipoprotein release transport system permease subunit